MTASAVFAKTDLGRAEVANRTGKLTPRERRILIFIDGKHTVADLRAMAAADDLTHTLGMLEEEGFIELVGVAEEGTGTITPEAGPLPSITAFRPLPAQPDAKTLEMAKHFMINTIKTFCGGFSHVSLQSEIFNAPSHEALREYYDRWYHAIVESRDGKRRSEELRSDLLKVI
ncbi:MAG: hypothetical protein ACK4KV_09195 [Rhodocyclaceae bacterium]